MAINIASPQGTSSTTGPLSLHDTGLAPLPSFAEQEHAVLQLLPELTGLLTVAPPRVGISEKWKLFQKGQFLAPQAGDLEGFFSLDQFTLMQKLAMAMEQVSPLSVTVDPTLATLKTLQGPRLGGTSIPRPVLFQPFTFGIVPVVGKLRGWASGQLARLPQLSPLELMLVLYLGRAQSAEAYTIACPQYGCDGIIPCVRLWPSMLVISALQDPQSHEMLVGYKIPKV